MSSLTAIESYLGWHISIMVLVWGVFLVRFNQTARGFFDLRYDDRWDAQVLRWGIIIVLNLVIPAAFASPAFYCTGFVQPVGWIIRGSTWMGYWGFFLTLTWMILLRLGSKSCRCGGCRPSGNYIGGPPRRRHWRKPNSPNRRRHSRPEDDAPRDVVI
jgi:hypothetical protein